jgi:phosphate transport system substrate-binding protein
VYTSSNPDAYPISAYSYMVTQCSQTPDRDTCRGPYSNSGVADTLEQWMRYIACDGQVSMAEIGYSPLPPNLSQELVNSIGRMTGSAPETLTRDSCSNPRFGGSLGAGSQAPKDPLADLPPDALSHGGTVQSTGGPGSAGHGATNLGSNGGGTGGSTTGGTGTVGTGGAGASGVAGAAAAAVGGGSSQTRAAAPVRYDRPLPHSSPMPILMLLLVVTIPLVVLGGGAEGVRRIAKGEVGLPKRD